MPNHPRLMYAGSWPTFMEKFNVVNNLDSDLLEQSTRHLNGQ